MKAITDMSKITESIGDRVGGYNFLPAFVHVLAQGVSNVPLYSAHPMGITESSFLGCAGSEGYSKDWSPSSMRAPQHKPNDSTRISTGQSSFRGRVRCQSLFIAGERRRCEPGSNSVIVTNTLTSVEGHVLRLGGVLRTRKIFVGCPAIRPIWDQSPGMSKPRPGLRLLVTGSIHYTIKIRLCRSAAEAQIQDRSRAKTGPNTAPGFSRVSRRLSRALPRHSRGGGNPEKNKARHLPSRHSRAACPVPRYGGGRFSGRSAHPEGWGKQARVVYLAL